MSQIRRRLKRFLVAAVLFFSVFPFAGDCLTLITPEEAAQPDQSEGTIGTVLTITGSGFGTKKGKVLIDNRSLKILDWTDESIRCSISKAFSSGLYDVTIQPYKTSQIALEQAFVMEAPEIESVVPPIGSINDEIAILGHFFGTKKGKVTLSGKKCKVLSWRMDPTTGDSEIHFVVPRILGDGTRELQVINGVGTDTTYFTLGTDKATSFQYPMEPYIEGHRYFDEWTDNYGGRYHAAQDCYGKGGDPVYAIANGVVSYSDGEGGDWRGYGYLITIDHQLPDGALYYSLYGHLSTRRWKKQMGEPVYKGQLIAYLGDDDEDGSPAWGPHLHFGIRSGKQSDSLDFLVGYYSDHPALHGWVKPGEFIEEHRTLLTEEVFTPNESRKRGSASSENFP